jgi:hypothetical protein
MRPERAGGSLIHGDNTVEEYASLLGVWRYSDLCGGAFACVGGPRPLLAPFQTLFGLRPSPDRLVVPANADQLKSLTWDYTHSSRCSDSGARFRQ